MSAWRLLIIDDEASSDLSKRLPRSENYALLREERIAGEPLEVVFAENLADATAKIERDHFHLAIIDVVLQKWGDKDGDGFEKLLLSARSRMSVAVISSQWDVSSIGLLRRTLENHPTCDVRLLLRWRDLTEQQTRTVIAFQVQQQIYRDQNCLSLQRDGANPLRILHISDLHFGASKQTLPNLDKRRLTTIVKRHWKEGPDFLAVTGDVANSGHPGDYGLALEWFQWLAAEFKWELPTRRILLVPGNHDVSIPLAAGRIASIRDKKVLFDGDVDVNELGLAAYAMTPFQDFAQRISSADGWGKRPFGHWIETAYRHYGVVFAGLNSCGDIDREAWPKRQINRDNLRLVEDEIVKTVTSSGGRPLLSVVLAHHSPLNYATVDQPIENVSDVEEHLIRMDRIEDGHSPPLLVLHGHAHKRNAFMYDSGSLIVSAPTPSPRAGREPDNARGFTMIELGKDQGQINQAKVFSYIFDNDEWLATPEVIYGLANGNWTKQAKKSGS